VRRLEVTFWDVGQGDCSTITLPDGRIIIIDVGPRNSPLIDWLSDHPRQIHAVVLTHNDSDHAGALPALIGGFKNRIENFFMLVDRPTQDHVFKNTFRSAYACESLFPIRRLEVGAKIWNDRSLEAELLVVFPTMSANVLAANPNSTSGILSLGLRNKTEIIWPGDSSLGRVASRCSGTRPYLLFGPHHGAPEDYRLASAITSISSVSPSGVFISVGTGNRYSHPRPKYIQRLERLGCQVVCSQLTAYCERKANVQAGIAVLPSHFLLGLRPPRKGTSCRGAMRLTWNGYSFERDGLDDEHFKRISRLRRPQCLKGRKFAFRSPSLAG
jgi:competence protein ComEC